MKKMTIGSWITSIAVIAAIAALIVYSVNIGGEGYFSGGSVTNLVLFTVGAAVLLLVAIVISMLNDSKVVGIAAGLMQIAAPALLAYSLISLISARVEGLGFIYFSNADVALEVQTPANLSSAQGAIASMIVYGIAMLVAIVAAFFSLRKAK